MAKLADIPREVARLQMLEPHPATQIHNALREVARDTLLYIKLDTERCWIGTIIRIDITRRTIEIRRGPQEALLIPELREHYGHHVWKAYGGTVEISFFDLAEVQPVEAKEVFSVVSIELRRPFPCTGIADFLSDEAARAYIATMKEPDTYTVRAISLTTTE